MKTIRQVLYEGYTSKQKGFFAHWTNIPPSTRKEWEDLAETVALAADPYYLLRKAVKEGKKIEWLTDGKWVTLASPSFNDPVEDYRIKKEFEPKVGEYYKHETAGVYILSAGCVLVEVNDGQIWFAGAKNCKAAFGGFENDFTKVNVKIEEKIN